MMLRKIRKKGFNRKCPENNLIGKIIIRRSWDYLQRSYVFTLIELPVVSPSTNLLSTKLKAGRTGWVKIRIFTLIELLVVIAIIAILSSILLPALQMAKETSRTIQCAGNMKQCATAMQAYESDNDGYFPPRWGYYWTGSPSDADGGWIEHLRDGGYLQDVKITHENKAEGIGQCPTARARSMRVYKRADLAYNGVISSTHASYPNRSHLPINRLQAPSKTYLIGDGWLYLDSNNRTCSSLFPTNDPPFVSERTIHRRHGAKGLDNGTANMTFTDGHIDKIRKWSCSDSDVEWRGY